MFSLGIAEILILLVVLGLWIGVPLAVVLIVLRVVRRQSSDAHLLEENEALRREVADLQRAAHEQRSQ